MADTPTSFRQATRPYSFATTPPRASTPRAAGARLCSRQLRSSSTRGVRSTVAMSTLRPMRTASTTRTPAVRPASWRATTRPCPSPLRPAGPFSTRRRSPGRSTDSRGASTVRCSMAGTRTSCRVSALCG
jgi:hypothetical protein